ncbi:hypothetical protein RHSIM_Rhsim05G0112800 [Rhododendron simsii]|uniref:Reverse transcriptase domain-containing protein n=1 Tax=Rhododendron simsii TaxID=118357 RepID=A0A834GX57_RHOSS|nr:hypothetical protein RHSIM_Rhsim05G0112800 [Rhododendron simsii]
MVFSKYVEPEGVAGGLALWWNNEVSVDVEISNKNMMHTMISTQADSRCWAATFVYGSPTHARKEQILNMIRGVACSDRVPWLCIGDFNQVLNVEDKRGGNLPNLGRIRAVREMLEDCGLTNLECKGPKFTWRNNRSDGEFIMERIDLAFANSKRREDFDTAMVLVEVAVGSDYNLLLLNTDLSLNKVKKPFKFESFWTTEESCKQIVSSSWAQNVNGSNMFRLCKKLRGSKDKLKEWHKNNFEDLRLPIAVLKDRLAEVQKKAEAGFSSKLYIEEKIMRRQRNQVVKLKDENDEWQTDPDLIANTIQSHFTKLYAAPPNREFEDILSLVDPIGTEEVNAALTKSVSLEEVQKAVFQMGSLKAPGSDGFPSIFYQKYWDVVREDVFTGVNEFFQNGHILKEMNHTNVALIPKVNNPESMSQFRPISLCRFNYKIVSKVLANKLQPFIHSLITEQQSAFIPGRQIHDNVIVAHEVFHFLKRKKTGGKCYVDVKLDLNKAYDHVCWDFLFSVLQGMGFNETWVEWIKECVHTVKYSINANREQVCNITPNRGLRQGDPLSPYLFLIAVNVFSSLMNKATCNKTLAGVRMKRKCPIVSHLLFADDSLGKAGGSEVESAGGAVDGGEYGVEVEEIDLEETGWKLRRSELKKLATPSEKLELRLKWRGGCRDWRAWF